MTTNERTKSEKSKGGDTIILVFIVGAAFGAIGQGLRILRGYNREQKAKSNSNSNIKTAVTFDSSRAAEGIMYGALCGLAMSAVLYGVDLGKEFFVACIGAGYAGADFIEGLIK